MSRQNKVLFGIMLALLAGACGVGWGIEPAGWFFPTLGFGRGEWQTSVGAFLWTDIARVRNLQLRGDVDLAPGLRAHTVIRSDREFNSLGSPQPLFDENYLEGYGFYTRPAWAFSGSLRVGIIRYLRFPYPDAISTFDQVPGVNDLQGTGPTGYRGELLTLDYAHQSGLGAHVAGMEWGFGRHDAAGLIEGYGRYMHDLGAFHVEARAGRLAVREEPLGRGAMGVDLYLGTATYRNGWSGGLLYEKLQGSATTTGIMVTFPFTPLTRDLGEVAFDYDRAPQGIALQLPLTGGTLGGLRRTPPPGATLVGEMTAARIRTYWQNGQVRNYYEHRLSASGDTTSRDLIVVMKEEPWYLQAEALVSPHSTFLSLEDLKRWETDREGPAQIMQRVTYQFYRLQPTKTPAKS